MTAAGRRGLEAMLLRPSGTRPLSAGADQPRRAARRRRRGRRCRPTDYRQAIEFARRGFAALVVMRRGYGDSGGQYAENSGPCGRPRLSAAGKARRAICAPRSRRCAARPDVTTQGMIAVGSLAGGFATIALAADPPQDLAAVINFAGGRGSRGDNDVCDEDALVRAFGDIRQNVAQSDAVGLCGQRQVFSARLARRCTPPSPLRGGRAQFIDAASFGHDGHFLFSATGTPIWTPMVDRFLREQISARAILPQRRAVALSAAAATRRERTRSFRQLSGGGPHKAFAVSAKGAFAIRSGRGGARCRGGGPRTPARKYRDATARSMRWTMRSVRPAPERADAGLRPAAPASTTTRPSSSS